MARLILNGESGESWTNTGKAVKYQFICNWVRTCGLCAQYDHAIGGIWPIPLHTGCRCSQTPIMPGMTAEPWVNFRDIIDGLEDSQRSVVVGASNIALIDAGVVKWSDVVTASRVRSFHEVISLNKLTMGDLESAGVKLSNRMVRQWADIVATPAQEFVRQRRAQLVSNLEKAGIKRGQIASAVAGGTLKRFGLEGPSGAMRMLPLSRVPALVKTAREALSAAGPVKSKVSAVGESKPLAKRPSDPAKGLRWDVERAAESQIKVNAEAAAKIGGDYASVVEHSPQVIAPGPINERLKAYTLGDAKIKAIIEADETIGAKRSAILAKERDEIHKELTSHVESLIRAKTEDEKTSINDRLKILHRQRSEIDARLKKGVTTIDDVAGIIAPQGKTLPVEQMRFSHAVTRTNGASLVDAASDSALKERVDKATETTSKMLASTDPQSKPIKMAFGVAPDTRAFQNAKAKFVGLNPASKTEVVAHEIGHAIEGDAKLASPSGDTTVYARSKEFLEYRVGDEPLTSLRDKFGKEFKNTEFGRKDRFDAIFQGHSESEKMAYYTGKHYEDGTEIVSMGIEALFADPVKFVKADPEYAKFILGILDGSLR